MTQDDFLGPLTEGQTATRRPGPVARVGLLATFAGLLLFWLTYHTDILFADGLRYIAQARSFDRGSGADALRKALDHPIYPLAIVTAHRAVGGDGPQAWQAAAQLASAIAGVLLVVPLYLVSRELFGDRAAWPACLLFYAVPLTGHVFADTLSESTFLLFWTLGLWGALRFFKGGNLGWLPLVIFGSAFAYLTRPEGLLLPAATLATLVLSPRWVRKGLDRRGVVALAILLVGVVAVIGPYVALRGGLGTKPSIARLLGTAPKSAAHAVERQRPLEPGQSAPRTYTIAVKAVAKAVSDAVTWPLLPFSGIGLIGLRPKGDAVRPWRLTAVIGAASVLALVRLHATGGYCSPRHAMILSTVLIPAAASGLRRVVDRATASIVPTGRARYFARLGMGTALATLVLCQAPGTLSPVNHGLGGYREAGRWLTGQTHDASPVVDVTGWSQFYSSRPGYTFENLVAAPADTSARWVVAREAHLRGPWEYCRRLRALVDGLAPVAVFQGGARDRPTRVFVYDRRSVKDARGPSGGSVRR